MSGYVSGRTSLTTVQTGDIAANAVTLAKLAGGTDGNLITYDTSGDPAAVAVGTSGHVLTSGGAGVAPTFAAAGGAWKFISSTTVSDAASVAFTGLTGYPVYKFIIRKLVSASASELYCTVSTDNGSSYISAAYDNAGVRIRVSDNSQNAGADNAAAQWRVLLGGATSATSGAGSILELTLDRNAEATSGGFANILFTAALESAGNDFEYVSGAGNVPASGADVDALKFVYSSGNIISAVCLLYGIAEA
jgi:hypothetical protein